MPEQTEMFTGMPRHVREAAENARAAEVAAAAGLMANAPAAPQAAAPAIVSEPANKTDGQQQPPAEPVAKIDGGAAATDGGNKEPSIDELKVKLAEAEALVTDQRNRLRRHHGQQRAAREAMEQEVANLKAELAKRDATTSAKTGSVTDDAILLRNGFTQDELDDMNEREKRIAAKPLRRVEEEGQRFASERDEMRRTISERGASTKASAFDTSIEDERPGFLAATQRGSESDADWALFGSEVNPDSATGLTWKETLETARKVGDKATVLRIADLFAKDAGLSFRVSGAQAPVRAAAATRVDVPPRRVMPSSGPAAPSQETSLPPDATTTKRTYPKSYEERFMQVSAARQGSTFRPFSVSAGGLTKTFNSLKDMERERDELLDAADEGRITRG
jgi:hypothetical protein